MLFRLLCIFNDLPHLSVDAFTKGVHLLVRWIELLSIVLMQVLALHHGWVELIAWG
jgi:hypothetical protein